MSANAGTLLVSVRPRFAQALLSGAKTVELRRVRPKSTRPGDLVLLYASSPTRRLVGKARVREIVTASVETVWAESGPETGLSYDEFSAYFSGRDDAVAIHLEQVMELAPTRSLSEIRNSGAQVEPPQSYRYLTNAQVSALLA